MEQFSSQALAGGRRLWDTHKSHRVWLWRLSHDSCATKAWHRGITAFWIVIHINKNKGKWEGGEKRSWWKSLSCVWLFATPWTIAHQAPLSMGFPREEYWSVWRGTFIDRLLNTRPSSNILCLLTNLILSNPESGRSPRGGHGNPLQYSCLENPMDRGAWLVTVYGVTNCWTWMKWLWGRHGIIPWQGWGNYIVCPWTQSD